MKKQLNRHKGKIPRSRINPSHRWSEGETLALLESIVDEIKGYPDSFEKPTGQRFYKRIALKSPILTNISWISMKSKMRYLKGIYKSTVRCNGKGNDSLKDKGEKSMAYITCTYFHILDKIFKFQKKFNSMHVSETSYDMDPLYEEVDVEEEDNKKSFFNSYIERENHADTSDLSESLSTSCTELQQPIKMPPRKTKASPERQQISKPSSPDSIARLITLQEKKIDLEIKKIEFQKQKDITDIELRKRKQEHDFELRKLGIEKDKRIQKYELELKYKTNRM